MLCGSADLSLHAWTVCPTFCCIKANYSLHNGHHHPRSPSSVVALFISRCLLQCWLGLLPWHSMVHLQLLCLLEIIWCRGPLNGKPPHLGLVQSRNFCCRQCCGRDIVAPSVAYRTIRCAADFYSCLLRQHLCCLFICQSGSRQSCFCPGPHFTCSFHAPICWRLHQRSSCSFIPRFRCQSPHSSSPCFYCGGVLEYYICMNNSIMFRTLYYSRLGLLICFLLVQDLFDLFCLYTIYSHSHFKGLSYKHSHLGFRFGLRQSRSTMSVWFAAFVQDSEKILSIWCVGSRLWKEKKGSKIFYFLFFYLLWLEFLFVSCGNSFFSAYFDGMKMERRNIDA